MQKTVYSDEQIRRFMKAASPKFDPSFINNKSTLKQINLEVAPPGWEKTIKKMKKDPAIDNPYAMAYWMHNRGIRPKGKKSAEGFSWDRDEFNVDNRRSRRFPDEKKPADPEFNEALIQRDPENKLNNRRKNRGLPEVAKFDRKSPPKDYPSDTSKYADPKNYKYPVDSEKRVRSAMSYFSNPDNRKGYTSAEQKTIWARIIKAAKKFGIEVSDDVKKRAQAEAVGFSSFGQLLKKRSRETEWPIKIYPKLSEAKVQSETKKQVQVIIMSEGLGNKRDMHFYSKECIRKAAPLFEGARCFIDHPSETEEVTRPERTLRDLIGYYTDVSPSEDGTQLLGTLCFEDTEAGKQWFDKVKTAMDYSTRYPDKVYFAISINADGKTHEEEKDGQTLNVVDEITEVDSADLVTKPALQTKFIKIMQSMREAQKTGSERRINAMAKKTRQAYADEARQLMKKAGEAEVGDVQQIGDLAKSLGQMYKAITPADQLISAEARRALKAAMKSAKRAAESEDEDDLDDMYDKLKKVVGEFSPTKSDEAEDDDEDEGRSRKAAEAEDEDDDEDEKKKSSEARKKADEDEDEDEDEAEARGRKAAEARKKADEEEDEVGEAIRTALKSAFKKMKSDDPGTETDWRDLVKSAQKQLLIMSEAEDDDEGKKRADESSRVARDLSKSLRESEEGKLATRSRVERFVEGEYRRLKEKAQDKDFLVRQARENAKRIMQSAHVLLQESNIPVEAHPLVMNQLLECQNEREMSRIIESHEAIIAAANGGKLHETFTKVEGVPGRRDIRENSNGSSERLLRGVVRELV